MPASPGDTTVRKTTGVSNSTAELSLFPERVQTHAIESVTQGHAPRRAVGTLDVLSTIEPADQYPAWHSSYSMEPVVRAHLWRLANGWDSHPRFRRDLQHNPVFLSRIGFDELPDQSTLWRAWNERFSPPLRAAIREAASNFAKVYSEEGYDLPGPSNSGTNGDDDSDGDQRLASPVADDVEELTSHAQRLVYPELDLDRHHNAAIPETSFWALQTYLGTHEDLCANGGAPIFALESNRERTPFGHNHRDQLRSLSVDDVRENFQNATASIVEAAKSEGRLDCPVTVAIDITTSWPFTGNREATEGVIGTKEPTDEYAYHWATIQIVDEDPSLILDVHPVRPGYDLGEIVGRLLDNALDHVSIELVLMDREFDSASVKGACEERGVYYLNPRRMHTSENAQSQRLAAQGRDCHVEVQETIGASPDRKQVYVPKTAIDSSSGETGVADEPKNVDSSSEGDEDEQDFQETLWDELDESLDVDVQEESAKPFEDLPDRVFGDDGLLEEELAESGTDSEKKFVVFETNHPEIDTDASGTALLHSVARVVRRYRLRWRIENAYYNVKRLMAKTTSRDFCLRYFYFTFASLLYNVWKLVDLLLRVVCDVDGEQTVVSFMSVAAFVRRETGIG